MEITLQLRFVLVCQFTASFSASELRYKSFSYNDISFMTLGLRFWWYDCITYRNNVTITFRFFFVIVTYFLLHHNYVIYLFDVVTFFYDVRLRYILVRSSYAWK